MGLGATENPFVARLREIARPPAAPPPPVSDAARLEQRRTETMAGLCNLPAFHPVAVKLLGISTEADNAMQLYADAFSADPALAAELLRRANSAEFGHQAYIGDIKRALMTLGLDRTRGLVVSISMSMYARKSARRADVYPQWAHSMATAVLCEMLAKACRSKIENLHTAGLMHDLGRLGFLLSDPDRYARLMATEPESMDRLLLAEKDALGMDHCEGGVIMAQRWGFPENLRDCIQYHHRDHVGGVDTLLGLVQIACRMADALGFPEAANVPTPDLMQVMPPMLFRNSDFEPTKMREMLTAKLTELWQ